MNTFLKIILCCTSLAVVLSSCSGNASKKTEEAATEQSKADSAVVAQQAQMTMEKIKNLPEEPIFDIITSMGVIKIKLYSKTPMHRENFAKLAFEGFYDGILFHRVIDGFMIQCGDPLTKDEANADMFGTGGPGYNVPAEFVPEYHHKKGALAAARRGDAANPMKESSGSQFYIVQDAYACAQLDNNYTVFGETLEGFDVIDAIAAVETNRRDRPVKDVKIITIKLDEAQ